MIATLGCVTEVREPQAPRSPDAPREARGGDPQPASEAEAVGTYVESESIVTDDGEVIVIREKVAKRPPRPVKNPDIVPRYSDKAIVENAWARAWLLLDVDRRGRVARLKLLRRPGYDLDEIAVEHGFTLRFRPAVDAAGRPTATQILWPLEWPSYWYLIKLVGVATRKPYVDYVPCRGSGPLNLDMAVPVYRDCSKPDLSRAASLPWIEAP